MSTSYEIGVHELDRRGAGGIDVALLWNARTNEVFLVLEDTRDDASFRIEVDASDALEAFRHPYAYVLRLQHVHAIAA
jgi:hypothetical protein